MKIQLFTTEPTAKLTRRSVEVKQGGGQVNNSSSEEADVTTAVCGLYKA